MRHAQILAARGLADEDNERPGYLMSIVFDVTPVALHRGGIGRYTGELLERLMKGRWAGELVCPEWGGAAGAESPSGWIAVAPVRRLAPTLRLHRLRLLAASMMERPDDAYWGDPRLLHVPDSYAPPLRSAISVITMHDLSYRLVPQCHTFAYRSFLAAVVPASVRRAAVVLADSMATRDDMVRLLGVPTGHIRVVYPGVSAIFGPRDPDACRKHASDRFGLDREFVLTVGTLEPRKNHAFLLEAFARFVKDHGFTGDLAVVGGNGWGGVRLEPMAARFGLENRVRRLRRVSDEDLTMLYGGCLAFALPSLYEGFGLPVAEAQACGAPVLVSEGGSLPEVAGPSGWVLPLGDPGRWARALADLSTEAIATARVEGPRNAARFSYDRAAREIEETWSRLLDH